MANKVESILEEIKGLTLLEAADLVKKMEETFGVSAAAAAAVVGGGGGGGGRGRRARCGPPVGGGWRGTGRGKDGIFGCAHRSGSQQDQRYQGRPRSHQP